MAQHTQTFTPLLKGFFNDRLQDIREDQTN